MLFNDFATSCYEGLAAMDFVRRLNKGALSCIDFYTVADYDDWSLDLVNEATLGFLERSWDLATSTILRFEMVTFETLRFRSNC